MNYRLLGKSGLRVSELCLGTMTFGTEWGMGSTKEVSKEIFDAFLNAGGNFFDTANIYTGGTSEAFLGEFMQAERERIVLATKYVNSMEQTGMDPNAGGSHRKNMVQAVEASLKRLNTEYIDLYYAHIWDPYTPIEETMRGLDDLVRAGKVLYVGISDAPAWVVSRANTLAEWRDWSPFIGLQTEYSLLERTSEFELFPACDALGIGITAWGPLAGGVLTGKYRGDRARDARYSDEEGSKDWVHNGPIVDATMDVVEAISKETGASMAEVSLAWMLQRPEGIIPIIGARTMKHYTSNVNALNIKLSEEHIEKLNAASQPPKIFPNRFMDIAPVRNGAFAGCEGKIIR